MAIGQFARAQAAAVAPPCCFVDHGPHDDAALARVAHGHALRGGAKPVQEGVVDAVVRIDLGPRRTLLPLQSEGRTHHALHGRIQIGAGGDVGRVLPAHLCDDGPRMAARRHRLQQIHAHFKAARERIAVDARVMRQHRARLRPAEYAIHAARRHAGTVAGAQQQRAGQRGAGRRLVDHGITCQQCRAHHVHGQRQREVEGRDDREHAPSLRSAWSQ
ncbi:hypothetical protein G6F68_012617 [Rhizopus microsporus]|nr:hypothetical protein G6F68_012617 [Rhizopus microsporus]